MSARDFHPVAIIPARGGSKRIHRKNIRPFLGVPLLVRAVHFLQATGCFDRIVVSTEDEEIASIARAAGADVPFMRPDILSTDLTPTLPVVAHAIEQLEAGGAKLDSVCCFYPGGILATRSDVLEGLRLLERGKLNYVFPATSFPYPIQRALRVLPDGSCEMFWDQFRLTRSQDLSSAYHDAGQFYWGNRDAWIGEQPIYGPRTRLLLVPRYRVQDIDTEEDWEQAERLFRVEAENSLDQPIGREATGPESRSVVTLPHIVLGTVQLGMPYGRRRDESILSRDAAFAILDAAWEIGIRAFDTAENYGTAAQWLSDWLTARHYRADADVITKLRGARLTDATAVRDACRLFVDCGSLTVLTHDAVDSETWQTFAQLASENGALVGQSVYTAGEVRHAAALGAARVQAPGNVVDLDRIAAAHELALPIDVRSVYLQGLLLDDPATAEDRVAGGGMLARIVQQAAVDVGIPAAVALVAAALSTLRDPDRLVLGVDSPGHLLGVCEAHLLDRRIIAEFAGRVNLGCAAAAAVHSSVRDPRKWS